MTLIEGQDSTGAELPGEHSNREVRQTKIQVGVPAIELEHSVVIVRLERRGLIPARGKVLKEGPTCRSAKTFPKQVVDLGRSPAPV